MKKLLLGIVLMVALGVSGVYAQDAVPNRIDLLRPDAPALAHHGSYAIGVRTLELVHADQVDIVNTVAGGENVMYDRPLTVEVWYPSEVEAGTPPTPYTNVSTRDVALTTTLIGRAVRDAQPMSVGAPYPLIIVSHGYPGNRFLLAHLAENLASKGYVVASIDHTDSVYTDQAAFGSTLLNRSLDQLFVLNSLEEMGASSSDSFLAGLVDTDTVGMIGYSMGGYGVVNVIGGGYTEASVGYSWGTPNGLLAQRQAGNADYEATFDARIKAAIAIGPWGMETGFWDAEGLKGIRTPILFMAGSLDNVSGYTNGTRAIYEASVNADRYLLTFESASHNAAAPYPVPHELVTAGSESYSHYMDPVWDTVRMNNIAQHFATAFFGVYLQEDETLGEYLNVTEYAFDGVYDVDAEGNPTDAHTYWAGFPNWSGFGLRLEHALPASE
ncbi:MAG: alpha/beta hydrolase family protein [Phototrophicaceae bacterium]